ncbi:maleylacetoacetate isomerase [Sulfitobacter sp. S0837]|uniref:maleylacetoacetate isomerase n=1 Tax=Sulfitobacter maritimus TaxID=2741719 RepID=UPI00158267E1|nr:maleylacetoacetate isomerase [Sulfitobacter maritimus]NUH65103.1 maleylacetoacetate isomerase [Sulfitobacter maritimus]
MITLYDYWRSSASYRVRIALGLAGLGWQTVSVDLLAGEHKAAAHLARNPQGLVPALEIDGHLLTQSLAIVEYLDETRGLGLLPNDPSQKARIRASAHAIAVDLHPICNLGPARHAVSQSAGGITMESWMQHFIAPGLAAFEVMIDGGTYCHGEKITLTDICLMPQVYNANRWGVSLESFPKLRAAIEALSVHPAFAAAHPDQVLQS